MKFNITQHCRERYIERVQNGLKIQHNLLITMLETLNSSKDETKKIFAEIPRYIQRLLEKYRTSSQRILINYDKNVIFILKKRPGTGKPNCEDDGIFDVLTCYKYDPNYLSIYKSSVQSNKETYLKIIQLKKEIKAEQR